MTFVDNRLSVPFTGGDLTFALQPNGEMTMQQEGRTTTAAAEDTQSDHYFNLDVLPWKTVMRGRYVSSTEWVTEMVSVRKTRTKSEWVTVPKTRSVYDPFTKNYRTESYMDSENRMSTEWYDDQEPRQVLKTRWDWKKVPVQVLDIPHYTVYRFDLKKGGDVLIYAVPDPSGRTYFFQHAGYCTALEKMPGIFGTEVTTQLVLLDVNQNGRFDDPDDQLLFNTWNPFDPKSGFQEISGYMDNQWFRLSWLAEESFLTVKVDEKSGQMVWINANTPFLKSEKRGIIELAGLPANARLAINGAYYEAKDKAVFSAPIEYGYFKAVVAQPGHFDQVFRFEITESRPTFKAEFEEQPSAATLTMINYAFRSWKLTAADDQGKEWAVFSKDSISVPK